MSSNHSALESPDDCDLLKISCHGGMANWLARGCEDSVRLLTKSYATTAQCPLQRTGICNATKCDAVPRRRSMPEFKIMLRSLNEQRSLRLAGERVVLFVGQSDRSMSVLWSSDIQEPLVTLEMSASMKATATPTWCFGPRARSFYMVACLTAASGANERKWPLVEPPTVEGPPLNDRCSTLQGVCGTIGLAPDQNNLPREWCKEDGTVPPEMLVDRIPGGRCNLAPKCFHLQCSLGVHIRSHHVFFRQLPNRLPHR